ncbi:bifunctional 3'-5' exonuclease/DNA polymerase [Microbacterium sp. STN6]|uniref:bifunctional 3'-5' exonuclease/DNA polymerase n=1 Tax=Microbacterium sp. STN6 TaxID=2995588 RepID=UPI002260DDD4|nr:bifunctional 3'-5' exonuclease/DNA polymerase [Microbacterium sp. STN6]MCX7522352.1 bifunctional 3'-5' exonuclease/DNA polymerase [Microbacterium sp. STN6]
MLICVAAAPGGVIEATRVSERGAPTGEARRVPAATFAAYVRDEERGDIRWVWHDTTAWYPALLRQGVRVGRCVDLRLCHAILRHSSLSAGSELALAPPCRWDALSPAGAEPIGGHEALFEVDDAAEMTDAAGTLDPVAEFAAQCSAVAGASQPARLQLLLTAESAGALVAAELRHAGLPWRHEVHEAFLADTLGPRPRAGERPVKVESLANEVRTALGAPQLNPDSPAEVLKALRVAGLNATSTRSWELKKLEHPAIAPLLEYKKRARLLSANGWAWQDAWVQGGRFHAEYMPGGVVTGRWAARGGGALQLPKQVRHAVVADEGWKLVVADAAQLEPRVLAGLASDEAMAAAGRGRDLYTGIVESGAVAERAHAKVAMLGAMYGATTGESARLMPALTRAFPRAIRLVEQAARAGERGDVVTSRLGRSSPRPGAKWVEAQSRASVESSRPDDERRARSQAREWGRFTRNFIVQSSAAEWALCWMAQLRMRLADMVPAGTPVEQGPHLVYFLHDEVMVHTPEVLADRVAEAVSQCAAAAGRLLFGGFPVEFPVTTAIVDSYADAK